MAHETTVNDLLPCMNALRVPSCENIKDQRLSACRLKIPQEV